MPDGSQIQKPQYDDVKLAGIEAALAEADNIPATVVSVWLNSWGTEEETRRLQVMKSFEMNPND